MTEQRKIDRRAFLKTAAISTAVVSMPNFLFASDEPKKNIIFIQCDSMDGRSIGCMGHPAAYTPNIDALAKRGTLFRNTYCNSPLCTPSRASLYSGKYADKKNAWNNNTGLSPDDRTYKKDLEGAGYATKNIGKDDYLSNGHTLSARLGAWLRSANIDKNMRGNAKSTLIDSNSMIVKEPDWKKKDEAIDWLEKNATQKQSHPFMLYVGITYPHPPYKTSNYWWNKINPDKVNIPVFEENLHPVIEYSSKVKGTFERHSEVEVRNLRRTYLAMIAEVDEMVGQIIKTADALGLDKNSYYIFSSDHGDMTLEHRLTHKQTLYEGAARIPLIITGPDLLKNSVVNELVSLVDLYPTFDEMAGISKPKDLDGNSLMPLLKKGKDESRPKWVFSEYNGDYQNTGSFMLREADWKYIAYAGYEPQLFNLKEDPDELKNLANEKPEVVKSMDAKLKSIVNYEAVDKRAKEYDKKSFIEWRNEQSEESYKEAINDLYDEKWYAEIDNAINKWLNKK